MFIMEVMVDMEDVISQGPPFSLQEICQQKQHEQQPKLWSFAVKMGNYTTQLYHKYWKKGSEINKPL